MTTIVEAGKVGSRHVGRHVNCVGGMPAGVLRWVTHTSDETVLAVETCQEQGAAEYRLNPGLVVTLLDT